MKRIFVAEDDAALSRGICMALQSDDLALIPYGTIREARLKARRRRHSGAPSVGEEEGVGIGLYLKGRLWKNRAFAAKETAQGFLYVQEALRRFRHTF